MDTETITVTIKQIDTRRTGGLVVFTFVERGFPKQHDAALTTVIVPIDADTIQLQLMVPSAQRFAIKVLHDENGDGKVTKNWTGIVPKDGLGFSNGARIRLSAPSFSDASIMYAEELAPVIHMNY